MNKEFELSDNQFDVIISNYFSVGVAVSGGFLGSNSLYLAAQYAPNIYAKAAFIVSGMVVDAAFNIVATQALEVEIRDIDKVAITGGVVGGAFFGLPGAFIGGAAPLVLNTYITTFLHPDLEEGVLHVPIGTVSSSRLPGQFGTIPMGYETNALDVLGDLAHMGLWGGHQVQQILGQNPRDVSIERVSLPGFTGGIDWDGDGHVEAIEGLAGLTRRANFPNQTGGRCLADFAETGEGNPGFMLG